MKLHAHGVWAWTIQTEEENDAMATDLDGKLYTAGSSDLKGVVSTFFHNGTLISTTHVDSPDMYAVRGIALDKAGDVIIVGPSKGFAIAAIVAKIRADGTQAWLTTVAAGLRASPGGSIVADCEGNAYFRNNVYKGDLVVQVYANGTLGWTFDMANVNYGVMAMDEQGDIVIAGRGLKATRTAHISKIKTNMGCSQTVEVSPSSRGVSSSSRRAEAQQMLAALAVVVLAIVANPFHTQEMEQP